MPAHVKMHRELEPGCFAGALDEWCTALGDEDLATIGPVAAQLTQRPDLVAAERMCRRRAVLLACDVDEAGLRSIWSQRSSASSDTQKPWCAAMRMARASR